MVFPLHHATFLGTGEREGKKSVRKEVEHGGQGGERGGKGRREKKGTEERRETFKDLWVS